MYAHAIVDVNVVIGVMLCGLLVVRVVPVFVCDSVVLLIHFVPTSTARGTLFVWKKGLVLSPTVHWAENFHLITQHHCAVLHNKDTFTRFHVYADPGPLLAQVFFVAVEGMVVTGKFRRAPDPFGSYFTVTSIHSNNECAERRSVRIAMLLLTRDICMKLGAVILTSNVNKDAERS